MSALTEFLPAVLARFMVAPSGHPVEVEEQLSGDIARALVDGLADIGVFADSTPVDGLSVGAVPDRRAGADLRQPTMRWRVATRCPSGMPWRIPSSA